jgi:hypothetical protein
MVFPETNCHSSFSALSREAAYLKFKLYLSSPSRKSSISRREASMGWDAALQQSLRRNPRERRARHDRVLSCITALITTLSRVLERSVRVGGCLDVAIGFSR